MPVLYHGTSHAFAAAMAPARARGTIDVTRGGGEFGQGFYTQDSKSSALRIAQFRHQRASVLELSIDDQQYVNLRRRVLRLRQAIQLTQTLRSSHTMGSHLEGVDVVIGPLNGDPTIEQQKFESAVSEALLNGPLTQRKVL